MDITHVTIVPSDKIVLVNGESLEFDFEAPENIHAVQWDNTSKKGHVEYVDCVQPNKELTDVDYANDVMPYVLLWQAEKNRLEEEAKAAEEARLAEYNSEEARWGRLRTARDAKLAEWDYYVMPDYPADADKLEKVKAYRQALRDLPSLEGAPWDGGGSLTPFPVLDLSSTETDSAAAE